MASPCLVTIDSRTSRSLGCFRVCSAIVGQVFILLSPAAIGGATASPTWSTVSSDPPMPTAEVEWRRCRVDHQLAPTA